MYQFSPMETVRRLRDNLGVDLGTAKVMINAMRNKHFSRELQGAHDLVVELRDSLKRAADEIADSAQCDYFDLNNHSLYQEIVALLEKTRDYNSEGLKGDGWSNNYYKQRVDELEERCKEHRQKRAELEREINELRSHAKFESSE